MKLSQLIRKREVATETLATTETVTPINSPSVATVATVIVNMVEIDASHFMWQVIMPEGELTVTNSPEATLAEMRKWYPTALKIEPLVLQAANEVSDFE